MVNVNCKSRGVHRYNKLTVPYKIDTGSDGNKIPWYISKKLFPRVTEAELIRTIKRHIKLKT